MTAPNGGRPKAWPLSSGCRHGSGPWGSSRPLQLDFRGGTSADWDAWAEPVDAVPEFTERIQGSGGDLVRYAGPGGLAVLRHRGRGEVRLLALDDVLAEWAEVVRDKGDADLPLRLPGLGVYPVQSRGSWVIETERERP